MKVSHPLLVGALGLGAASAVRLWMRSLSYKIAFYDPRVDPAHPECTGRKLYVFWHENILFPLYMRGHCELAMLVSRHHDADLLTRVARHLGFDFVRGSSRRGGVAALRTLAERAAAMHLAITPDGPRGPRRTMAAGAVYLASALRMPLVAMGFGYDRPWRLPTWDRFAIPRPGSRARAVIGPAMHLPPDLDRGGIEHYRRQVERLLNRLTDEAESWALAGTGKVMQQPVRPETLRRPLRRAA